MRSVPVAGGTMNKYTLTEEDIQWLIDLQSKYNGFKHISFEDYFIEDGKIIQEKYDHGRKNVFRKVVRDFNITTN